MYVLLLGIIRFTPLSSDCGLGSCSWCRWWWWQQQNTTNAAYHHHHTQHHSIYIHLFPQKTHTLFCTLYSLCFVVSSSSGSRFFNTRVCVCKFPSLNLSVSEFKCNHHLQPHDNLEMKYKLAKRKKSFDVPPSHTQPARFYLYYSTLLPCHYFPLRPNENSDRNHCMFLYLVLLHRKKFNFIILSCMSVFWRVWATFDTRMASLTKFIQLYDHETETKILCTRIFALQSMQSWF